MTTCLFAPIICEDCDDKDEEIKRLKSVIVELKRAIRRLMPSQDK